MSSCGACDRRGVLHQGGIESPTPRCSRNTAVGPRRTTSSERSCAHRSSWDEGHLFLHAGLSRRYVGFVGGNDRYAKDSVLRRAVSVVTPILAPRSMKAEGPHTARSFDQFTQVLTSLRACHLSAAQVEDLKEWRIGASICAAFRRSASAAPLSEGPACVNIGVSGANVVRGSALVDHLCGNTSSPYSCGVNAPLPHDARAILCDLATQLPTRQALSALDVFVHCAHAPPWPCSCQRPV